MRYLILGSAYIFFQFFCPFSYAQNQIDTPNFSNIIRKVYENNPALKAAREELAESKELYPQARAGWLPTIAGETSIYATDIESSNFSTGDGATTKDVTLSLDQPIWRGGRTFSETARAHDIINAGEAILAQAEQDLFFEAARIYAGLIRDVKILHLRIENEKILHADWKAAWERQQGGELTITDVDQAKTQYLSAHAARIQAENELDIRQAEFEEIAGMAVPSKLYAPQIAFNVPDTIEAMITLAEQQNPELKILQFQQQAAEHDVDARFRELLPQVSAFASYNKQYDPQPGIVPDSQTRTIGLRATLALYEGGATRSRIRAAKHAAKRQEYEIQESILRVRQEVISNWRSYQTALQQTKLRREQIITAEKALRGMREEERMGQRSLLDIFEADEDLIEAKTAHVNARYNETVTQFALANSLGLLNTDLLSLMSH